MANKSKKSIDDLKTISTKSTTLIKGTTLGDDSRISSMVNQMTQDVSKDFGKMIKGSLVNYWNEISVRDIYTNVMPRSEKSKDGYRTYQEYMETEGMNIIGGVLDGNRSLKRRMENYRAISKHIPECSRAREILKTTIISPDDYTKKAMAVVVTDDNIGRKNEIIENGKEIVRKYEIEDLVDEIVGNVLVDSAVVVSVQSLDDEFIELLKSIRGSNMLTEDNQKYKNEDELLVEAIRQYDVSRRDLTLHEEDVQELLTKHDYEVLVENIDFGQPKEKQKSYSAQKNEKTKPLNESEMNDKVVEFITNFVNENVIIGSSKEKLTESAELKLNHLDENLTLGDIVTKRGPGRPRKNEANIKTLGLNGSIINTLPAENVVEVKKDNMIYGYYLLETIDGDELIATHDKLNRISPPGSLSFVNQVDIGSSATATTGETSAKNIANILSKAIAKKLDAKFLKNNDQFKLQIYEILKNSDLGNQEKMKITFYDTNEIVMWKTESIFEKVEFFAKLYLAMLTNNILLALGRSHDKRVFYINMGVDKNYEQAIQNIIRDIKTKEIKQDTLADVNSILQLNPGLFHDYFIPTHNGERPIEIDTLQGMNQDMDTEFTRSLKDAILNGLPVPKTIIDASAEVEYSRSVAAQNGLFCRTIIDYQRLLTPGFEKLIRLLYRNEHPSDSNVEFDIDSLSMKFPSPLTLNMNMILEMFATATQLGENVATTLVLDDDQESEFKRRLVMAEVVRDHIPSVNWEKYEKLLKEDSTIEMLKNMLEKKVKDGNVNDDQIEQDDGPLIDPYAGF